tara:strand:+ start:108 stop:581 length:474 start_codon:yes stop_codon:yes gene_type:complete
MSDYEDYAESAEEEYSEDNFGEDVTEGNDDDMNDTTEIFDTISLTTRKNKNKIETINQVIDKSNFEVEDGVYDSNHSSFPFITKYEITKILGIRAQQLAMGSRPFVEVPKGMTSVFDIAKKEFKERKIPYLVQRSLPHTNEYWELDKLKVNNYEMLQ